VPAAQCPSIAPKWEDPAGVAIDAFLFGGRRSTVVPLVREAFDWQHGVFMGAIMSSETTAAAAGEVSKLRHDPFAMLPFCGYHMGDYFAHWLEFDRYYGAQLPKIFYVNWFRKAHDGRWLWPGYGENSRVIEWIFRRCDNAADAQETPIGLVPSPGAIDTAGLEMPAEDMSELLRVDRDEWTKELPAIHQHFARFGERLPDALSRAAGTPRTPALRHLTPTGREPQRQGEAHEGTGRSSRRSSRRFGAKSVKALAPRSASGLTLGDTDRRGRRPPPHTGH
jgi:phosphoenolpyruvate carboxykinase (GTP)